MPMSSHATTRVECDDSLHQPHFRLIQPAATSRTEPTFAHPTEAAIAELLTFHRVRWTYEPTTFVLERHQDGRLAECFTPDFYLPDHRLYLELTTMRQSYVTRKNRKLRRIQSLFPGAQVQVLYRRDIERILAVEHGQRIVEPMEIGPTLVAGQTVASRLAAVAEQLGTEPPDRVIALDGEALPTARLIAGLLGRDVDLLSLTRFRPQASRDPIRVLRGLACPVNGARVSLVTGRLGTGLRAAYARQWLERHGAAGIDIITLVDQPGMRLLPIAVRAAAFSLRADTIAGCGLDIGGRFAALPDLVSITEAESPS